MNTTLLHPANTTLDEEEASLEENALFHEHWLLLRFDLVNSVDLAKSYEAFITGYSVLMLFVFLSDFCK